jgi:peptide/nickel transport system permease protein
MGTYILKRVLLMVPTFAAISLLVFIVLQFAPGTPGAEMVGAGGEASQSADLAGQKRESYRLFKEQFNLDKPVLFNNRFGLKTSTVTQTLDDILNRSETVPPGRRIEAQEEIEDWGQYAIPSLISIVTTSEDRGLRALASQRLAINAQRPLKSLYKKSITPEERAENKVIAAENNQVRTWLFRMEDAEAREAEVVGAWSDWYATAGERWDWSATDKVGIFFGDTRFAKYWSNLIRLDFGISHVDKRPVLGKILKKLKYSITLAFTSVLLIYFLSVPLGIWSAVKQNTVPDRIVTVIIFILYSLPSFFTAVFLLNLLTRGTPFQAFPTSGFESLDTSGMTTLQYLKDVVWHVFLPIICYVYGGLAALSRYARTGILDVIRSDYVRTARAKGLNEGMVIIKHAARNGMIPILTLLATLLPVLISGSVVIEVIFGIPGMGSYIFESIGVRDYNSVMGVLLISAALTLVGMLLSDISYALVDPRISFD